VARDGVEIIQAMEREALVEALGEMGITPGPAALTAHDAHQNNFNRQSSPREYYSPWTGTEYESRPSQRQLVEVGPTDPIWPPVLGQPCPLEPQPCDDCGKCRALGF